MLKKKTKKRFTINKEAVISYYAHEDEKDFDGTKFLKVERASHIEPYDPMKRIIFKFIREYVPSLTQWTRTWKCYWQVRFVNRPQDVYGPFRHRESAIKFETDRLNTGEEK